MPLAELHPHFQPNPDFRAGGNLLSDTSFLTRLALVKNDRDNNHLYHDINISLIHFAENQLRSGQFARLLQEEWHRPFTAKPKIKVEFTDFFDYNREDEQILGGQFGLILRRYNRAWTERYRMPLACIGFSVKGVVTNNMSIVTKDTIEEFDLKLGDILVHQIQGVSGAEQAKTLQQFYWEKALLRFLIRWGQDERFRRICVISARRHNDVGSGVGNGLTLERAKRHYDDPAEALGFTLDPQTGLYVLGIQQAA